MELNTDAYYEGLTEKHMQEQSDITELALELCELKEAFDICYEHLCDLHFCAVNDSIRTEVFLKEVLQDIKKTAETNEIFIAKKKEEDERCSKDNT